MGKKYHVVFLLAADFYRVVLTAIDDNEVTSYINAVHIPVSNATKTRLEGNSIGQRSFLLLKNRPYPSK